MAEARTFLAGRPPGHGRFVTLDAMRGVAALVVVLRHFSIEAGGYDPRFSYLAVDLFFLLSGFVLAFAYDGRFAHGLGAWAFLKLRVLRLYPIYLLGLAISLVFAAAFFNHGLSGLQIALAGLLGALGLPAPPMAGQNVLFPLNAPFWSLFFEFWVANLIFCVFWKALHGRVLAAVIAACAIGLIVNERLFYTFNVGWSWENIGGGVVRVGFSFFAGVALCRLHRRRPPRLVLPSALFLLALIAVFATPLAERAAHVFELAAVFLMFPALVFFGASAKERFPELGSALGDASYAAYAIHMPLAYAFLLVLDGPHPADAAYGLAFGPATLQAGLFCLAVAGLALAVDLGFDRPARRRLVRLMAPRAKSYSLELS